MYILRVIPIANGLPENVFTYFSKEHVSLGSLVEIKIRNRKLNGIVISSKDLIEEKMDIKNSNFVLKKIEGVIQKDFLKEDFLKILNDTATLLGTTESRLISTFTLKESLAKLIENNEKETALLPIDLNTKSIFKDDQKNFNKNKIVIDEYAGRIKIYKNIIRESLAKKESLVIYFSTINELQNAKEEIEKGIEKYCVYLHSDLSTKDLMTELEKLKKEKLPVVILSTPSLIPFFVSEKINLQTIILEKENSYYYFTHNAKVQLDARVMIKNLGNNLNLNLIFGAELPSLETYLDFKNKKIAEYYKNTFNSNDDEKGNMGQKNIYLLNMSKDKNNINYTKENVKNLKYDKVYFSTEIILELEKIKEKDTGHAFIYTKRKGLYTETVCNDCNSIYKCEDCDKPFILFNDKKNQERFRMYICPSCKKKKELKGEEELICKNCLG
jgi:hypothetical protein